MRSLVPLSSSTVLNFLRTSVEEKKNQKLKRHILLASHKQPEGKTREKKYNRPEKKKIPGGIGKKAKRLVVGEGKQHDGKRRNPIHLTREPHPAT